MPWKDRVACKEKRAKARRHNQMPQSSDCVGLTDVCAAGGQLLLRSDGVSIHDVTAVRLCSLTPALPAALLASLLPARDKLLPLHDQV